MIIAYSDGSCSRNPGPGGFGAVILESWDHTIDNASLKDAHSKRCDSTTNNREELKAILWIMEHYGKENVSPLVYSDSAYCVNSLTLWIGGWKERGWKRAGNKPLENLDLIQEYDRLYQEGYRIDLRKIPGHAGVKWNEVADKLATGKISKEEVMKTYG